MRLAILIVASAAVLALAGCKKPAEDHAEEPGVVVAAGAVTDPAATAATEASTAAGEAAAATAAPAADASMAPAAPAEEKAAH